MKHITAALLAFVLAGCASPPPAEGDVSDRTVFHHVDAVDQPPVFRGCTDYHPERNASLAGEGPRVAVLVDLGVTAEGTPANVRVSGRSRGFAAEAIRVAESCTYDPARIGGEPVAVRGLQLRFAF